MTDLQQKIELLEARANEAELIGQLACDPDTRARNRRLAEELLDLAQRIRGEARSEAA